MSTKLQVSSSFESNLQSIFTGDEAKPAKKPRNKIFKFFSLAFRKRRKKELKKKGIIKDNLVFGSIVPNILKVCILWNFCKFYNSSLKIEGGQVPKVVETCIKMISSSEEMLKTEGLYRKGSDHLEYILKTKRRAHLPPSKSICILAILGRSVKNEVLNFTQNFPKWPLLWERKHGNNSESQVWDWSEQIWEAREGEEYTCCCQPSQTILQVLLLVI